MTNAVEVAGLTVTYNGQPALTDVTFQAAAGEMIGIIGPNGAGKSTLMKAMLGMTKANRGTVRMLGSDVNQIRKRIAYVPQRSMIDFDFPVRVKDVVLMGSHPHLAWWKRPGKKEKAQALESLKEVGMEEYASRQIGELSGGQQQRVFLARALQQQGEILFLDEPFAGIDVSSERIIIELLRTLKQAGRTIFVVHHDLSKVEEYFDSILLLNQHLIGYGTKEDVFKPELLGRAYEGSIASVSGKDGEIVVMG
ncbi:metal ABC transporter ATP-binding protein [Alkalicoccus chagannorensis]|uniref:metal ABC transporter ATP-binding protein n=1 Tax=Alkalicoccus chagannorensis TaxID=427072 RepID=UPI000428AEF2|nr:metal ABC transporter ATP-binding protein [Alkalicoccus chagannorensis]